MADGFHSAMPSRASWLMIAMLGPLMVITATNAVTSMATIAVAVSEAIAMLILTFVLGVMEKENIAIDAGLCVVSYALDARGMSYVQLQPHGAGCFRAHVKAGGWKIWPMRKCQRSVHGQHVGRQ